jgi:cysteine-rich repeat protein
MGINNYLNAAVTCPSGTSSLNYVFTTSENNTVSQICYTTIVFCEVCTQGTAYYY